MKPTIEQVVAHFGLPDEALESDELKSLIDLMPWCRLKQPNDVGYVMDTLGWCFVRWFDCPITDWFKPNDGKGE